MKITEKMKLESWLTRYDFWLDSRGVPRGVRSALGREMRANLAEAAAEVGLAGALAGVGSPKELATEAAEAAVDPTRPRWWEGLGWATAAAVTYGLVVLLSMVTFFQGVVAAGAERGQGWAVLVPGMQLDVVRTEETTSMGATGFPWLLPVLVVLGFLAGSRIWRLAIPAEQRRERVRLPHALPGTGPRWAWGALAALISFLALGTELTVTGSELRTSTDPFAVWWLSIPGAVAAYLLIAQPWRYRRR